jgi:hypothetical protein
VFCVVWDRVYEDQQGWAGRARLCHVSHLNFSAIFLSRTRTTPSLAV